MPKRQVAAVTLYLTHRLNMPHEESKLLMCPVSVY